MGPTVIWGPAADHLTGYPATLMVHRTQFGPHCAKPIRLAETFKCTVSLHCHFLQVTICKCMSILQAIHLASCCIYLHDKPIWKTSRLHCVTGVLLCFAHVEGVLVCKSCKQKIVKFLLVLHHKQCLEPLIWLKNPCYVVSEHEYKILKHSH